MHLFLYLSNIKVQNLQSVSEILYRPVNQIPIRTKWKDTIEKPHAELTAKKDPLD